MAASLVQRIKRPLRPPLRRLGLIPYPGPPWPSRPRRSLADVVRGRPPVPIAAMTREEFASLRARHDWYKARELYMSVAAVAAADLIRRHQLRTALELGPHLRPLITGADAMELTERDVPEAAGRLIVHDATRAPWPIPDGGYDLFVALQVFEHLGTSQREAFAEVTRVAKHAVISLPIDWVCKDPTNCHHQISNERALSWFAPWVPDRILEGNPGPSSRLVYVFEHLDRDPAANPRPAPPVERPPQPGLRGPRAA